MPNKKVLYTCISGKYDKLLEPRVSDGFDYVCFTDDETLKSNIWDIRPLPTDCEGLSSVKAQRKVKILPHKYLPDYDECIWVDANVSVRGDLNEFISTNCLDEGICVFVPTHPSRNCIYDEGVAVIRAKKDVAEHVNPQLDGYRGEGFPKKYGLLQSNILYRKHMNKDCIRLMEAWWNEVREKSHRDQLSFNYALWKNSDVKVKYLDKSICSSKWFLWNKYHLRK